MTVAAVIDHIIERQFVPKILTADVEWVIPLGDNWVLAWEVAKTAERDTGIDRQEILRVIHKRFFADRNRKEKV